MLSIGQVSRRTGVKISTIRYYEDIGLLKAPERTDGNQRRYGVADLELLDFIRHARGLGFSIGAISTLIELKRHPDRPCLEATEIARTQLVAVRSKIRQLKDLETELSRIKDGCDGESVSADCYVLTALSNHDLCETEH